MKIDHARFMREYGPNALAIQECPDGVMVILSREPVLAAFVTTKDIPDKDFDRFFYHRVKQSSEVAANALAELRAGVERVE